MTKRGLSDVDRPFVLHTKPTSQRNAMAMALKYPKTANWPVRTIENVHGATDAACEALVAGFPTVPRYGASSRAGSSKSL